MCMKRISAKTDEIINSSTHAFGIGLSIVALVLMIVRASVYGTPAAVVGGAVFGAGMIVLYTASTIFHATKRWRLKYQLNKFDHSAIYVLIAATYTPITLVTLGGVWGWTVFGIVWAMALAGIIFKVFFYTAKYRLISTIAYIAMGLVIVIALEPLIESMPLWGLVWMAIGGVSYIAGAMFYLVKNVPLMHGIFHLFVLGGSFSHFWAIYHYVLPVSIL
jgi:hemolysin III